MSELPVGPLVDATPAKRPGPVVLEGRYGRLEKLGAQHAAALWRAVKGHDHIWTYMSGYGPFADEKTFTDWIASRVTLDDACVHRDLACVESVQLRYHAQPIACRATRAGGRVVLELECPAPVAAPGQMACLLAGDRVVGQGTIGDSP